MRSRRILRVNLALVGVLLRRDQGIGQVRALLLFDRPNDLETLKSFLLSSETIDPHLNDGNADIVGNTRGADATWNRGAYEFNTGAPPTKPNPLQKFRVTGVE
jgi:hypothetical protein